MTANRVSFGLMILSWGMGVFFIEKYFRMVTLVIELDRFYWVSPFMGLLGATLVISILTLGFYWITPKLKSKRVGYLGSGVSLVWLGVLLVQIKIIAYNLSICH